MARLRGALGRSTLVQTVVKRGYRLALDPAAGPDASGGHCVHGTAP
jgi:uroporphyrinogen-III synthase